MPPIGLKLRENARQTICNFRFRRKKKIDENVWCRKYVFRHFRWILEELGDFWHQNLVLGRILLQVHNFSGLYDAWSSISFVRSTFVRSFVRLQISLFYLQAWAAKTIKKPTDRWIDGLTDRRRPPWSVLFFVKLHKLVELSGLAERARPMETNKN